MLERIAINGLKITVPLKSEVLITLLTFEATSSFPVVLTPVVDSTFSVFVTVEENTSPDDVL